MPPRMPPQLSSAPLPQTTEEEKFISQNWGPLSVLSVCVHVGRERNLPHYLPSVTIPSVSEFQGRGAEYNMGSMFLRAAGSDLPLALPTVPVLHLSPLQTSPDPLCR